MTSFVVVGDKSEPRYVCFSEETTTVTTPEKRNVVASVPSVNASPDNSNFGSTLRISGWRINFARQREQFVRVSEIRGNLDEKESRRARRQLFTLRRHFKRRIDHRGYDRRLRIVSTMYSKHPSWKSFPPVTFGGHTSVVRFRESDKSWVGSTLAKTFLPSFESGRKRSDG